MPKHTGNQGLLLVVKWVRLTACLAAPIAVSLATAVGQEFDIGTP